MVSFSAMWFYNPYLWPFVDFFFPIHFIGKYFYSLIEINWAFVNDNKNQLVKIIKI